MLSGKTGLTAILILSCSMAVCRAGDSGELFPNVAPYDEKAASPISKPEIKRPPPSPPPPPPHLRLPQNQRPLRPLPRPALLLLLPLHPRRTL